MTGDGFDIPSPVFQVTGNQRFQVHWNKRHIFIHCDRFCFNVRSTLLIANCSKEIIQFPDEGFLSHRFRYMQVASCIHALPDFLSHGMGSECHNRCVYSLFSGLYGPYGPCSFITVHLRHLHIHEDHIEGALSILVQLHRFPAVLGYLELPGISFKILYYKKAVIRRILCKKNHEFSVFNRYLFNNDPGN